MLDQLAVFIGTERLPTGTKPLQLRPVVTQPRVLIADRFDISFKFSLCFFYRFIGRHSISDLHDRQVGDGRWPDAGRQLANVNFKGSCKMGQLRMCQPQILIGQLLEKIDATHTVGEHMKYFEIDAVFIIG